MTVKIIRSRPVQKEAIQWTGKNFVEVQKFCYLIKRHPVLAEKLHIITLEGKMTVSLNDWIIKGLEGEFYPCRHDIFENTYDVVRDKE